MYRNSALILALLLLRRRLNEDNESDESESSSHSSSCASEQSASELSLRSDSSASSCTSEQSQTLRSGSSEGESADGAPAPGGGGGGGGGLLADEEAAQYTLDHSSLIDPSALDVLLLEWGQSLRQAAVLPADERVTAHYGVFGAPAAGHLVLHFCRRLSQPTPVFFRALQLFERFMETHMVEMHQYIVTKVDRADREKEWKSLLQRIRSQAILRMLSCIQISSKLALHYKIITTKRVKNLLREVKHCYSLESVVNSEVRVLKTLKYQVSGPTCLDALETLLAVAARRWPTLLAPLGAALPAAAVRVLRRCCVRREQLLLTLYRRTTGAAQLAGGARRQFAAVLADAPLLAAAALGAAAFLVRRTSSEPVLAVLAELTLIPADDLRQLTEIVLADLLPAAVLNR